MNNIFIHLGFVSVIVLGVCCVYSWRYSVKNSKYKLLLLTYELTMTYFVLMAIGFDFNRVEFDMNKIGGFVDPPMIMTLFGLSFIFSRLIFKTSLLKTVSLTLSKKSKTNFHWFRFLQCLTVCGCVFSFLYFSHGYLDDQEHGIYIDLFVVHIAITLMFFLFYLPIPLLQKLKNDGLDKIS